MGPDLPFRGNAADRNSGDQALSAEVLLAKDQPFARPGRDPAALFIQVHSVGVDLPPLRIVQDKGGRNLGAVRVHDPGVFRPEFLQRIAIPAQQVPHGDHVVHQHDYVEILMGTGLLSKQRIDPPPADQPDLDAFCR